LKAVGNEKNVKILAWIGEGRLKTDRDSVCFFIILRDGLDVEVGAIDSKEPHSIRGEAVLVGGAGSVVRRVESFCKVNEDESFWRACGGTKDNTRSGPWSRVG
jgi:hypothetical protein